VSAPTGDEYRLNVAGSCLLFDLAGNIRRVNGRTDCELLGDYAENGSETAFTELVSRHVGLVYSAALRVVVDPHLAEDVTQATFTVLAREARWLRGRAFLSSWLHRTASNQAANLVRGEMRRRAREQEAYAMHTTESEPEWKELAPVLDAALNKMAERDRAVIFLRFFEKKTAADIARALSVTEEAAQKRISRALERLRASLCGKGVSLSTATLAALVSAQAVVATPIGLLASASTAALSGGAVGGQVIGATLKFLIMSKLKIGAVSALVAAAVVVPVLIHQNHIARLRDDNNALRQHLAEMRSENDKLLSRPASANQRPEVADAERSELLRLRGEVSRLRRDARELGGLPRKPQAERPAAPPTEEEIRQFNEQRTRTVAAVKQLGLQLCVLRRNAKAATAADGTLEPNLIARTHPDFDLKQVEMLVSESELSKIIAEAPETIIARTDPIKAPDGKWMRVYSLADGSVHERSTDGAEEAFAGNWQLVQTKPRSH
jgi:RNA polymerase sigma factor (sigma-70 family)